MLFWFTNSWAPFQCCGGLIQLKSNEGARGSTRESERETETDYMVFSGLDVAVYSKINVSWEYGNGGESE